MVIFRYSMLILTVLMSLVLARSVSAEGCITSTSATYPDSMKQSVAVIDATTGCGSVTGQWGCRIDDGVSGGPVRCANPENALEYFIVESSAQADGRIRWQIDQDPPTNPVPGEKKFMAVDTALYGGASQGNACGQFFTPDVTEGEGGYIKSNGSVSNVTYLDICTDGVLQAEPLVLTEPPGLCSDPGVLEIGNLDNVGIQCPKDPATGGPGDPSLVCNFESNELDGGQGDGQVCCFCNVDLTTVTTCEPAVEGECINDNFREEVTLGGVIAVEFLPTPGCTQLVIGGKLQFLCW